MTQENIENYMLKLKYLQDENLLLKDRIRDLEEIIKLNKEALKLSLDSPQARQNLINNQFTKEKEIITANFDRLIKERDNAKDQALISEQVANEFVKEEKETYKECKRQIIELRKLVEEKDKKLKEGIKIKNVVNLEERNLLFHNEIENNKSIIKSLVFKISKMKDQLQELLFLNKNFYLENIKLKEQISLTTPFSNNLLTSNPSTSLCDYHKRFFNLEENLYEMDENSPVNSPLPLKVINSQSDKIHLYEKVPKIDITKALLIQETNIINGVRNKGIKSELPLRENHPGISLTEQIKKLENELKRVRKLLQSEMLEGQKLKIELERTQSELSEKTSRISFFTTTFRKYEEKWKKISCFLSSFYAQYPQITSNSKNNTHLRNKSDNLLTIKQPIISKRSTLSMLSTDFEALETKLREQIGSKRSQLSFIDIDLDDNKFKTEKIQYIKYLKDMTIDFRNFGNERFFKKTGRKSFSTSFINSGKKSLYAIIIKEKFEKAKDFWLKEYILKKNIEVQHPRINKNLISPISKTMINESLEEENEKICIGGKYNFMTNEELYG